MVLYSLNLTDMHRVCVTDARLTSSIPQSLVYHKEICGYMRYMTMKASKKFD